MGLDNGQWQIGNGKWAVTMGSAQNENLVQSNRRMEQLGEMRTSSNT